MIRFKIPRVTVERLSLYLRCVRELEEESIVSSREVARLAGTSDAQVRKDLAYFGEFGTPGRGYRAGELKDHLLKILGLDRVWKVALVGVGSLGKALLAYPGFKKHGFEIKVAFDIDPSKIGKKYRGVEVRGLEKAPEILTQEGIKIGIVAVPTPSAQKVVDKLIEGGVKGILNFAPTRVQVPEGVVLKNVDLTRELESISFFLTEK